MREHLQLQHNRAIIINGMHYLKGTGSERITGTRKQGA